MSAADQGLLNCPVCHQLHRVAPALAGPEAWRQRTLHCSRCGAAMHRRKPDSLNRTWALLLAAAALVGPANLLPIMDTGSLFGSQRDTIWSGVVHLWVTGSWVLATIVFVASMVVPMAKLGVLGLLCLSVQRGWRAAPRARTRAYRLVEAIGRWSMVDIYAGAVLVALVQIEPLAVIRPGPGAIAFGAVVVLTMMAAMNFDPRLIWDATEPEERTA
jgi:paraquat-inducible protein A